MGMGLSLLPVTLALLVTLARSVRFRQVHEQEQQMIFPSRPQFSLLLVISLSLPLPVRDPILTVLPLPIPLPCLAWLYLVSPKNKRVVVLLP
jgi:hypothetical protein